MAKTTRRGIERKASRRGAADAVGGSHSGRRASWARPSTHAATWSAPSARWSLHKKRADAAGLMALARAMAADAAHRRAVRDAPQQAPSAPALKVKIAAYQWRASKLAPKKYGNRLGVDLEATQKFIPLNELAERVAALRQDSRFLPGAEESETALAAGA